MLKGIPNNLSPDLLHALASMGHGDEIVLADANFPASSCCSDGAKLIYASGINIPDLLTSILKLMPLDTYVYNSVCLMDLVNSDKQKNLQVPIWAKYQSICDSAEGTKTNFLMLDRFEFYERAKTAFAIVSTGEMALYGNIILKKGVISSDEAKK